MAAPTGLAAMTVGSVIAPSNTTVFFERLSITAALACADLAARARR